MTILHKYFSKEKIQVMVSTSLAAELKNKPAYKIYYL